MRLVAILLFLAAGANAAEVTVTTSESRSDAGIVVSRTEDHKRDGEISLRVIFRDSDGDGALEQNHVYLYRNRTIIVSYIRNASGSKLPSNLLVDSDSKIEVNFQVDNSEGRLRSLIAKSDGFLEVCMIENGNWRLATEAELNEVQKAVEMWK